MVRNKVSHPYSSFDLHRMLDKQSDEPIELQCSTDAIQRIVAYLTYHAKEPPRSIQKPLLSTDMKELVCEFDCQFTDVDHDTMFNVLLVHLGVSIRELYSEC